MDRPRPSWRSRAPSVSANLPPIEVRATGRRHRSLLISVYAYSRPAGHHLHTHHLHTWNTQKVTAAAAQTRRGGQVRRSHREIRFHVGIVADLTLAVTAITEYKGFTDAWIGQGSAEEGSTSRTTQSGMVYAYPRNAQRVAGLRNCTPSAAYAEATKATQEARLVTRKTALAGGEPNTFRIAARFPASGYFAADSAIDNASRAPSSSARQQRSSQSPTA